MSHVRYYVIMW